MDENTRAREAGQRAEVAAMMAPLDTERADGDLPPERCDPQGVQRWLQDRAVKHRAREALLPTSDGRNEAADRAHECEEIARDFGRYWLGSEGERLA